MSKLPAVLLKFIQPISPAMERLLVLRWNLFKLHSCSKGRALIKAGTLRKLEKQFLRDTLKLPPSAWKRFQAEYAQAENKEEWLLCLFELTPLPRARKPKAVQIMLPVDLSGIWVSQPDSTWAFFPFESEN